MGASWCRGVSPERPWVLTCSRADLVPVFSFGENDVRLRSFGLDGWVTDLPETYRFLSRCRTKRELFCIRYKSDSSPYLGLRYHFSMGGDSLTLRLSLLTHIRPGSIYNDLFRHSDNLGLLPYRRRIVSVSKYTGSFLSCP